MNTFRLTAVALATLALAASASAADVKIYGRIDTGLIYQNYFGDSTKEDSFAMQSGTNTATRVGIEGLETINDDLSVGFRVESRYASDPANQGDRLPKATPPQTREQSPR
ncbi:MAG: porin [Sutterella wadsworthensis]